MQLFDVNRTVDYVLRQEIDPKTKKPRKGATTWKLRALRTSEMGALDDAMLDFSNATVNTDTDGDGRPVARMERPALDLSGRQRNRVRLGVVGWDGLLGPDGQPVPYTPEQFRVGARSVSGVPMDVVDALPPSVLRELADKIEDLSSIPAAGGN